MTQGISTHRNIFPKWEKEPDMYYILNETVASYTCEALTYLWSLIDRNPERTTVGISLFFSALHPSWSSNIYVSRGYRPQVAHKTFLLERRTSSRRRNLSSVYSATARALSNLIKLLVIFWNPGNTTATARLYQSNQNPFPSGIFRWSKKLQNYPLRTMNLPE